MTALTLLGPAAAGATQRDFASTTKALRAYYTYLAHVTSEVPAWRAKASLVVAAVTSGCPNVLAALNVLSARQIDQGAAAAFGEEAGGDLFVAANRADTANFGRLARRLRLLHWSKRSTRAAIARYVASERGYLDAAQSNLCNDAQVLAADNALTTPPGTLLWLARFSSLRVMRDRGFEGFVHATERFEIPADRPIIARIDRLSAKVIAQERAFDNAQLPKVLGAFGLST